MASAVSGRKRYFRRFQCVSDTGVLGRNRQHDVADASPREPPPLRTGSAARRNGKNAPIAALVLLSRTPRPARTRVRLTRRLSGSRRAVKKEFDLRLSRHEHEIGPERYVRRSSYSNGGSDWVVVECLGGRDTRLATLNLRGRLGAVLEPSVNCNRVWRR